MSGKHKLVGLSAVFGLLLLAFITTFPHPAAAATGINPELSFEGKIVTSASGTNLPDGTYNMEYQIYTGCTNNTGSGCTSVWTENYLDTDTNVGGVTFTSGTFQVNLGSITAFGTSVPWNTYPLYLSFEIGNNQACTISTGFHANCTGDGVMSPYILLTSSPYALNAGELGGLAAPTTTATASQCLQTSSSIPYTQLILGSCSGSTPTLQQAYNAGAGSSTPDILLTAALGTLDIQDAYSPSIGTTLFEVTAGASSGIGATLFTVGNTGNTTVKTSTNSTTALQVENNNGVAILSVNTLTPSVQVTGALTDSTETVSDINLIQDAGAGTNALTVDNNLGQPILTVGTNNLLINGDFEPGTTGWSGATAGGSVAQNTNPTYVYSGASSLAITTTTTAHTGAQVTSFSGPMAIGTYTLSFYAKASSGFATLEASFNALGTNNCLSSATVTTSFTYFSCTYTTTGTTTAISIGSSGTTALTFYIDAVEVLLTPNLLTNPGFENGTAGWSASGTGAAIAQNLNRQYVYHGQASLKITTSTTASVGTTYSSSNYISAQPSGGGAYTLSFYAVATSAITLSASLGSGTCSLSPTGVVTTGFTLYSCTATTTSVPVITINSVTTNATFYIDSVQLINGSTLLPYNIGQIQLRGVISNPVIFQGTSNSTTAFQIQNASASLRMLDVDTVNNIVNIGNGATGDNTGIVLALDTKLTSGDPTEVNGGMYYNSNTGNFRCGVAGSWENCIGGLMTSSSPQSAQASCTTGCGAIATGTSMYPANYCVAGRVIHIVANGIYSTTTTAPTLALSLYIGTNTAKASDTLLGIASSAATVGVSAASWGWSFDAYIYCVSTTSMWVQGGTSIESTTAGATVRSQIAATAATTVTNTTQNLYIFPAWGTSSGSNTITADEFIVQGM